MTTGRSIRVGDADRDAAAAQLREHYAQGRLTLDELRERLDRAFASRTQADLDAVMSDLPYAAPHRVLPSDDARRGGWQARAGWEPGASRHAWPGAAGGPGGGYRGGYGRRRSPLGFLRIIPLLLGIWLVVLVLSALGTSLGSGPSVLVFILAALAALRWLFGRRRWFPGPRPRRRPWWW